MPSQKNCLQWIFLRRDSVKSNKNTMHWLRTIKKDNLVLSCFEFIPLKSGILCPTQDGLEVRVLSEPFEVAAPLPTVETLLVLFQIISEVMFVDRHILQRVYSQQRAR